MITKTGMENAQNHHSLLVMAEFPKNNIWVGSAYLFETKIIVKKD
jgi:hypothetical protein